MTTASSSALGELIALAQAGGDLKTFKALAEGSTHTELNARLTRLGYKTLGRRLRVKDALIATPDAELPTDQIDWSKSDFYLEAEYLAETNAGRPPAATAAAPSPSADDDSDKLPLHYVVAGERVAVRDAPSRTGKALDVLRKGAVVIVRTIKWVQRPDKIWESWIKLEDDELRYLSPKQDPEKVEAWALTADADEADEKAGKDAMDLLTPAQLAGYITFADARRLARALLGARQGTDAV